MVLIYKPVVKFEKLSNVSLLKVFTVVSPEVRKNDFDERNKLKSLSLDQMDHMKGRSSLFFNFSFLTSKVSELVL